jgi:hypothetical protein
MAECKLFYQLQHDNSIYHVTCKKIHFRESESSILLDDDYDYEFIFQSLDDVATIFHVTCKLLSHSLIVNILNKKIYGMNFDVINFNCRLTLYQKLSLKQSLKQILPSYFSQHTISDNEVRLNSDENFNSSSETIENNDMETQTCSSMIDSQNMQSHLSTEIFKPNELRLFYQAPDEDNIYHIICKIILQDSENFVSLEDDYDYEFISDDSEMIFHVTCKLLPYSLLVDILNKETYGIDFDVTELKRRYFLTLHQKLNLEQNLKQIFPSYFLQHPTSDSEARLDSNENLNSSHESDITINNSWPHNDCNISHQDENGTAN